MVALVNALNKVDLPTLGKPTMPQYSAMVFLYLSDKGAKVIEKSVVKNFPFMANIGVLSSHEWGAIIECL